MYVLKSNGNFNSSFVKILTVSKYDVKDYYRAERERLTAKSENGVHVLLIVPIPSILNYMLRIPNQVTMGDGIHPSRQQERGRNTPWIGFHSIAGHTPLILHQTITIESFQSA